MSRPGGGEAPHGHDVPRIARSRKGRRGSIDPRRDAIASRGTRAGPTSGRRGLDLVGHQLLREATTSSAEGGQNATTLELTGDSRGGGGGGGGGGVPEAVESQPHESTASSSFVPNRVTASNTWNKRGPRRVAASARRWGRDPAEDVVAHKRAALRPGRGQGKVRSRMTG